MVGSTSFWSLAQKQIGYCVCTYAYRAEKVVDFDFVGNSLFSWRECISKPPQYRSCVPLAQLEPSLLSSDFHDFIRPLHQFGAGCRVQQSCVVQGPKFQPAIVCGSFQSTVCSVARPAMAFNSTDDDTPLNRSGMSFGSLFLAILFLFNSTVHIYNTFVTDCTFYTILVWFTFVHIPLYALLIECSY